MTASETIIIVVSAFSHLLLTIDAFGKQSLVILPTSEKEKAG